MPVTQGVETFVPPRISWWCDGDRNMHTTCNEYSRLPCNCKCHPELVVTEWCFKGDHEECNNHPDDCTCECHPIDSDEHVYVYEGVEPLLPDPGEEVGEDGISWWCGRDDHDGCNDQPDVPCCCDCHPEEEDDEDE